MNRLILIVAITVMSNYGAFAQVFQNENESHIVLQTQDGDICGSLLLPEGDSFNTVVLLVSGSGPTDRDGNQRMMRSNSMKMIALSLAENNIASVRFDKRGIGASRGAWKAESDLRFQIFIDDVSQWVELLRRDGRFQKIVLMGHSKGAQIAITVAAQGSDVDAIVSISGPARTMDEILKEQFASQPKSVRDVAYSIIDSIKNDQQVKHVPFYLNILFRPSVQLFIRSWMENNPQEYISQIKQPILLVQGDTDIQVPVTEALLLKKANPKAEMVIIQGMNHVLKDCTSMDKAIQDQTYVNPALPINQEMVKNIVAFINKI